MPTKIKKRRRINNDSLTIHEQMHLLTGFSYLRGFRDQQEETHRRMEILWKKHRKHLMEWWMKPIDEKLLPMGYMDTLDGVFLSKILPGTRPWGFWVFDCGWKGKRSPYVARQAAYLRLKKLLTDKEKELLKTPEFREKL